MEANLVECERCRKTIISEEFSFHYCSPYISGTREIILDNFFTILDRNGDRVIIAKGLDYGVLYRLVECKHNPTHRTAPRPRKLTTVNTDKKDDKLPEPFNIR